MSNYEVNYITVREVSDDNLVKRYYESIIFDQPDARKELAGMINYWNEKKRGDLSDDAKLYKLILDYDNCIPRKDVEKQFIDYEYIIYNSANNNAKTGVEKFRVILTLTEPIIAKDLSHWRKDENNRKQLLKFFKGVDVSSFDVGRFFYRPTKHDAGRR